MLRTTIASAALIALVVPGASASPAASSLLAALLDKQEAPAEDHTHDTAARLAALLAKVKSRESNPAPMAKLADMFDKAGAFLRELDKHGNKGHETVLVKAPTNNQCTCSLINTDTGMAFPEQYQWATKYYCNAKNGKSGTFQTIVNKAPVTNSWGCPGDSYCGKPENMGSTYKGSYCYAEKDDGCDGPCGGSANVF